MTDKVKKTSNKGAGKNPAPVKTEKKSKAKDTVKVEEPKAVTPKTIYCLELIYDRSNYEGLKKGYYPNGFMPVQHWANEETTCGGERLARKVEITEKEYEKGKRV